MNHRMSLYEEPFNKMKRGEKTVELRCNDEKRRRVQVGDFITFTKLPEARESVTVIVKALYPEESFQRLFQKLEAKEIGFAGKSKEDALNIMRSIYPEQRERVQGVLGIRVQLVD